MSGSSSCDADSNGNKENVNQGNSEKKQREECSSESDCSDLELDHDIDKANFRSKYSALQQQWLSGHSNEENGDGEHSYILQYLLNDNTDNAEIVFHPKHSYSYTNYEKERVLPSMNEEKLLETKKRFESHINRLEKKILAKIRKQQQELDKKEEKLDEEEIKKKNSGWIVPQYCVPIRADIRAFDFPKLASEQKALGGRLFDAIMMDPPWQLATANPTRGVALGYSQLSDNIITSIPVQLLQENGLIFVWVINAKYRLALELFKKWGYTMIADIAWVKQTVNRRIANGHGYYLQHAKETCLVGLKGDLKQVNINKLKGICSDVIYSERRGQSQKPEEIYQYIEQLIPNGYYMEIFARRNNLRNGWFSIGNEL